MSARVHFVVEGQTEETFVNRVLVPHLATYYVWADVRCVMTSKNRHSFYRGGLLSFLLAKKDITLWAKEDRNRDVFFTTMFDLYSLPPDFPGFLASKSILDPRRRVAALEDAMKLDINEAQLIPYIQLHEFEALVLADPRKLYGEFIERTDGIKTLAEMITHYESPELVDDGEDTAPSKRIIKQIPEYEGRKASVGPIITQQIGIAGLKQKCQHFGAWLNCLEKIGGTKNE